MMGFIKLHTEPDKVVFINPVYIVKIQETDFPPTRTLISTMDDACTPVVERPYEVLDRIFREGRE